MITLRQTLHNIKSDYIATGRLMNITLRPAGILFLFCSPCIVAMTCYRISRYLYLKKLKPIAWFLWQLNIYITKAEIMPSSDIDESFAIGHCGNIVISGKVGKNVIMFGSGGIGGGRASNDIGAGPGLPVIEDNVQLGYGCLIMGPVTIGRNAKVAPLTVVDKSVPENAIAIGNPCRIMLAKSAEPKKEESAA